MMMVLIFSLMVTLLCCYTVHIIQSDREYRSQTVFVTLYHHDVKSLRKPMNLKPKSQMFDYNMTKSARKDTIISHQELRYPVAPRLTLDMRV